MPGTRHRPPPAERHKRHPAHQPRAVQPPEAARPAAILPPRPAPAAAAPPRPPPRAGGPRCAVVVGTNYAGASTGLAALRYAEADAQDMATLLREEDFEVVALLGPAATRAAIIAAVERQSQAAAAADGLLVVYFSGHGAIDAARVAYLVPDDANGSDLPGTALPIRALAERHQQGAASALTILDCCHSGYALEAQGPSGADAAGTRAWAIPDDGATTFRRQVRTAFALLPGRVVFAACSAGEQARELGRLGHGLFTYYVLEHWRYDQDVDVLSLIRHVEMMMERAAAAQPVSWYSPRQGRLVLHAGTTARRVRIPHPPNPLFVGRARELEHLARRLRAGGTPALTGIAGSGKTQIAVELAYRLRSEYPGGVFWLAMDPPETIPAQIAAYAGRNGLNLPGAEFMSAEARIAAVRAAWDEPLPRLLVFDNLQDPALLDRWRPQAGGTRVLITTWQTDWPAHSGVEPWPLPPLPPVAGLELLLTPRARRRGTTVAALLADGPTADAAGAMYHALDGLPLALALVASYLQQHDNVSVPGYAALLAARVLGAPGLVGDVQAPLPTDHARNVAATFALSYDQLDAAVPTDALALTLLHRAAWCAATPIPGRLLRIAADVDADDERAVARADEAVLTLARLGLIQPLPRDEVRLHGLLGMFLRDRDPDPQVSQDGLENALIVEVEAILQSDAPGAEGAYLAPLYVAVERAAQRGDAIAASLLTALGRLLEARGQWREARPYYERALALRRSLLGNHHRLTLASLTHLGVLLVHLSELAGADPVLAEALIIAERDAGPAHPITASCLSNLALLRHEQGNLVAAQALDERALAIREQALGPTHVLTATSLNNLAQLRQKQGDLAGAQALYQRALAIRQQALGPTHPATAGSLNNLAELLRAQGDLVGARPLCEQALAIWEQAHGPMHPVTATCLCNLAAVLREQGDLAGARPLHERALAIHEQVLGPTHPATATSLQNLAELLRAQGDLAGARPLHERALAIREQALGQTHPDTANSLNNLASLLQAQGDLASAEPLYARALIIYEQVLGPRHPATATSLNNLGLLRQAQGDLAGARSLLERALALCERALGTEHPTTRAVRGNLIRLLDTTGAAG